MNRKMVACGALLIAALSSASTAQTAHQIVEESQRRAMMATSLRYEGTLQVTKANGKISEKHWHLERIGTQGSSKTIVRLTDPPEVRGISLLVVNHPQGPPDQWLWVPSVGRMRKVVPHNRSARFFDTDFSFEDVGERDIDQYDYQLVGTADVDGAECWSIVASPKQEGVSQYTSSQLYVRHADYAIVRVDNYVGSEIVRTIKCRDIQEVQGIPTAFLIEVSDIRHRSHTTLKLESIRYNIPLRDEDFTVSSLKEKK